MTKVLGCRPQLRVDAVNDLLLPLVVNAQSLQLRELAAGGGKAAVEVGGAGQERIDDEGEQGGQKHHNAGAGHENLLAALQHAEVGHGVPSRPFTARRLSLNCTLLFEPCRVLLIVTSLSSGEAAKAFCSLTTLS